MKIKEIKIGPNVKLSKVPEINPLPTDAIIHKRIPGIGATHSEVHALRHSIIVLPNVPVIKGKVGDHNKKHPEEKEILGVYKGKSKQDIIDYLNNPKVIYKKILITPESYHKKFKEAVADSFDDIKKNFYLLIDECERAIQDVDFRKHITAPFDDLFDFVNKGLVSATTLPFSEPKLSAFTHYVIKPEYVYSKQLELIITNNVVAATRKYFSEHPSEHHFVFTGSITLMKALINALDIKKQSRIHCSEERMRLLRLEGYKASSDFDKDDLAKYNFFTARFYSAVDMCLDYKADVLMISDVLFAEHSIIDPQTEAIQIPGRFRNGTNSITHITNVDPALKTKTEEEALAYVAEMHEVYKEVLAVRNRVTSEAGKLALDEVLATTPFARFFYRNGSYNWFMVDNYIQEQRVLSMYKSAPAIRAEYKKVKDHYELVYKEPLLLPLTDQDRLKRLDYASKRALIQTVIEQYKKLYPPPGQPMSYNFTTGTEMADLKAASPLTVEAMETIGEDGIVKADYNERKIRAAIKKKRLEDQLSSKEVIRDVYASIKANQRHPDEFIRTTLQAIFDKHRISKEAVPNDIILYFEAHRTTMGDPQVKAHNVKNPRFNKDN